MTGRQATLQGIAEKLADVTGIGTIRYQRFDIRTAQELANYLSDKARAGGINGCFIRAYKSEYLAKTGSDKIFTTVFDCSIDFWYSHEKSKQGNYNGSSDAAFDAILESVDENFKETYVTPSTTGYTLKITSLDNGEDDEDFYDGVFILHAKRFLRVEYTKD